MRANQFMRSVSLVSAIAHLAGCGGGGSSSASNPSPPVPVPAAPEVSMMSQSVKTLAFTWNNVSNETEHRLLENSDGNSGFTQVATISVDSEQYEHMVFLPDRVNASYILQACNGNGDCSDSNELLVDDSLVSAIGYFKASNTNSRDNFGASIVISDDGSTLVVGANVEESGVTGINADQADNSSGRAGAVYVFVRGENVWTQQAYIKASNTDAFDEFGRSLSLSGDGDTLAVGAPFEDSEATGLNGDQADNSSPNSGAVYVFSRSGNTWAQRAYLKAPNSGANDYFGTSLAFSNNGDLLAVGAPREDSAATGIDGDQADNSVADSGAVYLFERSENEWSHEAYLKASNTGPSDHFGSSVSFSLDGSTLAVGAVYESGSPQGVNGDQTDDRIFRSGAAYVFTRDTEGWSQQAYLKASNTGASDFFGQAVELSSGGNTPVVTAIGESSAASGVNGNQDNTTAANSGAVYVFSRDDSTWTQQAYLKAFNTDADDNFGYSIALTADGDRLAVGAVGEDGSGVGFSGNQNDNLILASGALYLFQRVDGIWAQQTYLKASNAGGGDVFGNAVAISGDGSTLAVGAVGEGSAATGINGSQSDTTRGHDSGAVYLF